MPTPGKTASHQPGNNGGGKVTGELFTKNPIDVHGRYQGKYYATVTTTVSKYKEVDGNGHVFDPPSTRTGDGGSPAPNEAIHYTQVTSTTLTAKEMRAA